MSLMLDLARGLSFFSVESAVEKANLRCARHWAGAERLGTGPANMSPVVPPHH